MPPSISSAVSTSTAQMNSLCSVGSVSTLNPIALSNGKNSKNVISTENIIPMPPKLRFKMQCCHEFLCTIPMNGTTLNQIGLRKVDEVQIQPNVIDILSIMNKL